MLQVLMAGPAAHQAQLVDQADAESEVRLAELDEHESPRPDPPALKEDVHTLDPDKP